MTLGTDAGSALCMVRTGPGRAGLFMMLGIGAALIFWAVVEVLLRPDPFSVVPPAFVPGLGLLVLIAPLALMVQQVRASVVVDRTAGTVTVRTPRGLWMTTTVLPAADVSACVIESAEYDAPRSGGGVGAVGLAAGLLSALMPPRQRMEHAVALRTAGARPLQITPRRETNPYRLLRIARPLSHAIGCPLETPFDRDMEAIGERPGPASVHPPH